MKNVGFCGGDSILELGPVADMQVFFYSIKIAALRLPAGEDSRLLGRVPPGGVGAVGK